MTCGPCPAASPGAPTRYLHRRHVAGRQCRSGDRCARHLLPLLSLTEPVAAEGVAHAAARFRRSAVLEIGVRHSDLKNELGGQCQRQEDRLLDKEYFPCKDKEKPARHITAQKITPTSNSIMSWPSHAFSVIPRASPACITLFPGWWTGCSGWGMPRRRRSWE